MMRRCGQPRRYAHLLGTSEQVAVRRRAERIAHHQQCNLLRPRLLEDALYLALNKLAWCLLDGFAKQLLQPRAWHSQDRRVRLYVHLAAALDNAETLQGDVLRKLRRRQSENEDTHAHMQYRESPLRVRGLTHAAGTPADGACVPLRRKPRPGWKTIVRTDCPRRRRRVVILVPFDK